MNLEMEYNSGITVTVMQATAEDRVMDFNRRINSDLVVEVISITEGTAVITDGDLSEVTAIANDENGYEVITLRLGLTYEGTEISDEFTASSGVSVSQDSDDWTIEYNDDETGNWTNIMDVGMGIGVNNSDTNHVLYREIDVRVTLPLQNQTQTYDDGHAVNMRFAADGGLSEASFRVNVPQQYNISLDGVDDKYGVADGGETLVTLTVSNHGNGDDTIVVQYVLEEDCEDAGWLVTPPIANLTVAADNDRSQSFTIFAPANSTQNNCDVDFTADSEGDYETQEESTSVMIAEATLSILTTAIEPRSADALANEDGVFRIPIENTGFLTADNVIVYLESAQAGTDYSQKQITITVPAAYTTGDDGEVVPGQAWAEFPYSNMPPGTAYLKVSLEVIDTPISDEVPDEDISYKFSNAAEGEESSFLMPVIIILTILVLFGGYKTARKGSSGRF